MRAPVTVGVVTHDRSALFANMLVYLRKTVRKYRGPVNVLVVNNSGTAARPLVDAVLADSSLADDCRIRVIDSPENNISIARNLILEHCETRLLAFIDDDEYSRPEWLSSLVDHHALRPSAAVVGPTVPVYPDGTPAWVRAVDLHNVADRRTGDVVRRAGSGNCLLDLERIGAARFDVNFGHSGGEDGDFFETLSRRGEQLIWCSEAAVEETITPDRAGGRYLIFRFMKQGNNFARFMLKGASFPTRLRFRLRAAVLAPIGIVAGLFLLPFHPPGCARCWKGGFTNLGKVFAIRDQLYG